MLIENVRFRDFFGAVKLIFRTILIDHLNKNIKKTLHSVVKKLKILRKPHVNKIIQLSISAKTEHTKISIENFLQVFYGSICRYFAGSAITVMIV